MEYPEQTIARLTQRLGRAPTPEEVKAERDMLMRAVYGSMLLAEIHFSTWPLCRKRAVKRRALKKKTLHDWRYGVTSTDQGGGKRRDGITTYGRK